jgi:hypothetical protein
MKRLERMRWNGVMMRPRHKPKRDGRMSVPDQRFLPGEEGLLCHNELHMVYRVDHISIIRDRTRLMLGPRLEACTVEMKKGVCTALRLGLVLAFQDEQFNMTTSMIDNRHPPGLKRQAEEVEEDLEAINEVRVESVDEVVGVVMGGVGMGIAEMSDPGKSLPMARHLVTRTSNPSNTNPSPTNINNRSNNTLNIKTINSPFNKTRTRTTCISSSHISLSRLL